MTATYSELGANRPSIAKDPAAVLDYSFDWSAWLSGVSDAISSFSITASGVTVDSSARVGALVTVWCSGGIVDSTTSVTCRIVTTGGRTEDRTIYLLIRER